MDGVAACRAVLATHTEGDPGAHGWMVTQGQCKEGSRHGVMAKTGKSGMARQMRTRRCSTSRPACEAGRPVVWSMWVWRECGGAGRSENGLESNLWSPPNLSPLPVSAHTHSLNLQHKTTKFSPFIYRVMNLEFDCTQHTGSFSQLCQ